MVSTEAAVPADAPLTESCIDRREPLTIGLWLIIAMKSVTAILLWGAFILLLVAGHEDPRNFFSVMVFRTFHGNPPQLAIHYLVSNLEFISKAMVIRVAVATVAYALVESVEAIGLALRQWWAEWLVILVTVSFIPVEVYEIASRPNPLKAGTLLANILILWYLLKRLLDKRAQERRAILSQS
jgi:uncharacterized membrane protein (DUF2068 family)